MPENKRELAWYKNYKASLIKASLIDRIKFNDGRVTVEVEVIPKDFLHRIEGESSVRWHSGKNPAAYCHSALFYCLGLDSSGLVNLSKDQADDARGELTVVSPSTFLELCAELFPPNPISILHVDVAEGPDLGVIELVAEDDKGNVNKITMKSTGEFLINGKEVVIDKEVYEGFKEFVSFFTRGCECEQYVCPVERENSTQWTDEDIAALKDKYKFVDELLDGRRHEETP